MLHMGTTGTNAGVGLDHPEVGARPKSGLGLVGDLKTMIPELLIRFNTD